MSRRVGTDSTTEAVFTMNNNLGIYIHIPFCRNKCPYCDFFSIRANATDYKNYVEILKNRIKHWSTSVNKIADTIYIGGGTPGVLSAEQIAEIISTVKSSFACSDKMEITMEANPKSACDFDFSIAEKAGLNRVSLGVQSADEKELRLLGRRHINDDVINAVNKIKSGGIDNISLDLMLGIPEQTIASLKKSIDFCVRLDVKHISVYILKIEENTFFYKKRDKYRFPDDEQVSDLYLYAVKYLSENGFEQYEISNFCKRGYKSVHNLKYWNLEDYLGIGPAAHSFIDGKRFYYERSIESFADNKIIYDGEGGSASEYIMLQLRLKSGLNLNKYKEVFGKIPEKDFFEKIKKYSELGYVNYTNKNISFTDKGFLVSNALLADLI